MTDKPRVYEASADDSDVPDSELGALFAMYREPPDPARAARITTHVRRVSESRNLVLFGTLSLWRVLLEMATAIYVAMAGLHPKSHGPLIPKR